MRKLCGCCSQVIPAWDHHPACVKCRLAAGIFTLDINKPCSICESWSTITWGKLRKSLRDARQKSVKRGTQHWSCHVPALLVWLDSASTSSELISYSIADSDKQDVDLVSAAIEVSVQVSCSLLVQPHSCSFRGLVSRQERKDQSACSQASL